MITGLCRWSFDFNPPRPPRRSRRRGPPSGSERSRRAAAAAAGRCPRQDRNAWAHAPVDTGTAQAGWMAAEAAARPAILRRPQTKALAQLRGVERRGDAAELDQQAKPRRPARACAAMSATAWMPSSMPINFRCARERLGPSGSSWASGNSAEHQACAARLLTARVGW